VTARKLFDAHVDSIGQLKFLISHGIRELRIAQNLPATGIPCVICLSG
jgi:hypothetical protein